LLKSQLYFLEEMDINSSRFLERMHNFPVSGKILESLAPQSLQDF